MTTSLPTIEPPSTRPATIRSPDKLAILRELERKVLWLSSWMIHNANHIRHSRDGIKVGGHQSSCASASTLLAALYFDVLNPRDRVAVKPHASPVFHAIQYLLGNQTREQIENFRAKGGAQSYPSRTKDVDDVDFSTGSVGLGVGITLFASLIQDYVQRHKLAPQQEPARMIAIMGDAELDEGNIYEALLEGWKHDVRNLWWVIDYNRQSLDGVVNDNLFQKIRSFFETVGWNVINIKHGKRQLEAFKGPGGKAVQQWIDDCPNDLFSAITFQGGTAWRDHLTRDLQGAAGADQFLGRYDDDELHKIMTNLGGHDMESVLEAFEKASHDDTPTCFVAYTIKGYGLPLAGHKDNHAGLMTPEQMGLFKRANNIEDGSEWEPFSGLDVDDDLLTAFLQEVPFRARQKPKRRGPPIAVQPIPPTGDKKTSTQVTFGKIMNTLARRDDELSAHILTTSPDVTVSTNLSGWVNQRGLFQRQAHKDAFRSEKVASPIKWEKSPTGQHLELGIAENNLFLMLAAMGLSEQLFDARLLPVGTLYDPFISRGLDALNYACYQDARFILVATPSGITLAPEGGAHQSISTPLIGMAQDGLATFEPTYADELTTIMEWAFDYIQRDGDGEQNIQWLRDAEGGSVYLRLSTRPLEQPDRQLSADQKSAVLAGGYWIKQPDPGADLAIAYTGVMAPEALAAWAEIRHSHPGAGLLAVTSADRLNAGWNAAQKARQSGHYESQSHIEWLLSPLARQAGLVTVIDGHPATLAWLGSVRGQRTESLGVEHFGQSGDSLDLYESYRIDAASIVEACRSVVYGRTRLRVKAGKN
ncbi:MAG: transketolase [Rhodospirillales bacterium]|nr:transketolase [Rhodospirillales bacterium]